jgi:hypothetical protein
MLVFEERLQEIDRKQNYKFMVRQNDPRKTLWDFFIIIVAIYNCFSIPFQIAFQPPELETATFEALNNIIDLCFILDIIVAFRTTFYDKETGDEVYDPRRTAKIYLNSRFTIDLISTIPVDTIAFVFTGNRSPKLMLFSLLKLVRITRLSRIIARLNVAASIKNYLKLF